MGVGLGVTTDEKVSASVYKETAHLCGPGMTSSVPHGVHSNVFPSPA